MAIVTAYNFPADLLALLQKYGLPKHTVSFSLSCSLSEPLTLDCKYRVRMPNENETFEDVTEHRKFQLVEVQK